MKKQKQEKEKQSWWRWLDEKTDNPAIMIPVSILCAFVFIGLIISNIGFWGGVSCLGEPDTRVCTFNSHGYTLWSVFWTFLLITEAIFFVSLFWIKRKKDESIWHYTWVMKLYSMLFSAIAGVVCYVVVLPLSWGIGKFIMLLPKIVVWIIYNTWEPTLFIIIGAIALGVWYLVNAGLAKLFGSQDG